MTLGAEGAGHGGRRPREHRLADPVDRRAGRRARRRRRPGGRARRRSPTRTPATHELKGKAEPVRALARRSASSRGARRRARSPTGLEAPFVGRDRELRLVKELFHASAEERQGAPRLGHRRRRDRQVAAVWEFYKYIDGLVETTSVAPRPLPGLRRGRRATGRSPRWCGRAPASPRARSPASARAKLRAAVEEFVADPEERAWIEPRLAHLLGLEERTRRDREDLFAAWRLFFERLAERDAGGPRVRGHPVGRRGAARLHRVPARVVAEPPDLRPVARAARARRAPPDLGRRPRSSTSICARAARREAMQSCSTASSRACPDDLRARILDAGGRRAAVRGRDGADAARPRAARARGGSRTGRPGRSRRSRYRRRCTRSSRRGSTASTADERRLVQDAAVLGKTFTKEALAALTGLAEAELEPLLDVARAQGGALDPGRPALARARAVRLPPGPAPLVAYETLAKKERKARHLAAAEYLEREWGRPSDEIVEVLASHYLDAYRAAPGRARRRRRSGRRPTRLSPGRASVPRRSRRARRRSGTSSRRPTWRATRPPRRRCVERAGPDGVHRRPRRAGARRVRARAGDPFEEAGEINAAARVSARLGEAEYESGQLAQALDRMERSFSRARDGGARPRRRGARGDAGAAALFRGRPRRRASRVEVALEMAETLRLPELLSQALNTKRSSCSVRGVPRRAWRCSRMRSSSRSSTILRQRPSAPTSTSRTSWPSASAGTN